MQKIICYMWYHALPAFVPGSGSTTSLLLASRESLDKKETCSCSTLTCLWTLLLDAAIFCLEKNALTSDSFTCHKLQCLPHLATAKHPWPLTCSSGYRPQLLLRLHMAANFFWSMVTTPLLPCIFFPGSRKCCLSLLPINCPLTFFTNRSRTNRRKGL